MTRLILTTDSSGAECLMRAGVADLVIPFGFCFGGPLPSASDLAASLSTRSTKHETAFPHWLENAGKRHEDIRREGVGLIELCERCETIELWVDPDPNAQLTLIWLLDYLRHHHETALKLRLVQADAVIGNMQPEELAKQRLPAVNIPNHHLETASMAWQAYRASAPREWFDLLGRDISALPQLRPTVLELLEELPSDTTGLGATEMWMLELVAAGNATPFDIFPGHQKRNTRRVFGYWETGALLDGLVHCPAPAVSGLDEGPFTRVMHEDPDRHERYQQSELKQHSGRPFWQGPQISAGTIPSAAGGAAPN